MTHDDSLFAYLIALYTWTYGKNLSHFYIYKKKKFGDYKNDIDINEFDNEDIESAEKEIKMRLSTIVDYNKDSYIPSSISAQSIIDQYMNEQKVQYQQELELKQTQKGNVLNTLNDIYNYY